MNAFHFAYFNLDMFQYLTGIIVENVKIVLQIPGYLGFCVFLTARQVLDKRFGILIVINSLINKHKIGGQVLDFFNVK